jgi:hypothetical protein
MDIATRLNNVLILSEEVEEVICEDVEDFEEDDDFDEDGDFFDEDDLEEGRVKLRRVRGMERAKSRITARRYYKANKARIRRKSHTTKSKMMRAKRSRMGGKTRKGYRRTFAWSR